ncbi:hypothetical protein ACF08M_30000 [Streptomyces sp. NPDC015032]|uniref:hypothetical protein n=1 Tax=Streptomyces sp. NPDC015032 TaxID=3364937 RepID=UPI0036FC67EA
MITVILRLRWRTEARSRLDEKFTVIIVLALSVSAPCHAVPQPGGDLTSKPMPPPGNTGQL